MLTSVLGEAGMGQHLQQLLRDGKIVTRSTSMTAAVDAKIQADLWKVIHAYPQDVTLVTHAAAEGKPSQATHCRPVSCEP